jgi:hypothetical protein
MYACLSVTPRRSLASVEWGLPPIRAVVDWPTLSTSISKHCSSIHSLHLEHQLINALGLASLSNTYHPSYTSYQLIYTYPVIITINIIHKDPLATLKHQTPSELIHPHAKESNSVKILVFIPDVTTADLI